MALSVPTAEQAAHFARDVDGTEAFVATIMSPSAGSRPQYLFSIEMADAFLEERTIQDFEAFGLRLDIHYVDFGFLAQWLDEVIGDAELAAAIASLHDTGEAFGEMVPQVKLLLRERLDQCAEALGEKV